MDFQIKKSAIAINAADARPSRWTGGEKLDCAIAELDLNKRKVILSIKLLEEIEKKNYAQKLKLYLLLIYLMLLVQFLPVKEITDLAHSKGIIVVVDGCQGAPHLKLDMQDLDCDFYAISCHKMYGPTGLGVLYGKKKWLEQLPPYQGGGGMINEVKKDRISYGELPNKYEAGTMATAQVIAFDQSIKFLESIGIENIIKHEKELIEYGQRNFKKNKFCETNWKIQKSEVEFYLLR